MVAFRIKDPFLIFLEITSKLTEKALASGFFFWSLALASSLVYSTPPLLKTFFFGDRPLQEDVASPNFCLPPQKKSALATCQILSLDFGGGWLKKGTFVDSFFLK